MTALSVRNLLQKISQPGTYEPGTRAVRAIKQQWIWLCPRIDLFWKGDKTVKNATYWVSYSFIDSKRKYQIIQLGSSRLPDQPKCFGVMKYWVDVLNTQFCLTYNYTSGRQYNNPTIQFLWMIKPKWFTI
jgi:hypothetical protein